MISLIYKSFQEALKSLKTHFWVLISVQLPVGILVILQTFLAPYLESNQIVALLVLLPLFSIGSSFCTALTYLVIHAHQNDMEPKFGWLKENILEKFSLLTASSLLTAVFFALGLAALIVPGIYFIATYLFVPILVITKPPQKISLYLFESKKLITQDKRTLFCTMTIIVFSFLIDLPKSQIISSFSQSSFMALSLDVILTLVFGSILDCFIVFYFLNLQKKGSP